MRSTPSEPAGDEAEVLDLDSPPSMHQTVVLAPPPIIAIEDTHRQRRGSIEFESETPIATQDDFRSDFRRDLARVERWAAERAWPASPVAEFRVVVSERFRISRSLVPAWSGRAGHMEFPAWRVAARKAAIAHELVHAYFPNGNRLLAEGLAIYLQAEIGGNPAFPNFGKPLHALAAERLRSMLAGFADGDAVWPDPVSLGELDAIATPNPLTLRVGDTHYGEEPRGQSHLYPLAGSFVQHLIESYGLTRFRALYSQTPLVPLLQNGGTPERWVEAYGRPMLDIEQEWKARIADFVN